MCAIKEGATKLMSESYTCGATMMLKKGSKVNFPV